MGVNINYVFLLLTEVLLSLISLAWGDDSNILFQVVREGEGPLTAVNFNSEQFMEFHKCLCAKEMEICTAHFNSTGLNVHIDHVESSQGKETDGSFSSFSSCQLFVTDKSFRCNKLMRSMTPCDTVLNFTSYSLKNNSVVTCDFMCIGFLWNNSFEQLTDPNHNVLDFDSCHGHCYGILETKDATITTAGRTVSETQSYVATKSTKSSTSVTKRTDSRGVTKITTILPTAIEINNTATAKIVDDTSDNDIGLIAGLILGTVLVLVIGVIIFLAWGRRKRLIKSSHENNSDHHIISLTSPGEGINHQYINVSNDIPVYTNLSPPLITQTSDAENAIDNNYSLATLPTDNDCSDKARNDPTQNSLPDRNEDRGKDTGQTVSEATVNLNVQETGNIKGVNNFSSSDDDYGSSHRNSEFHSPASAGDGNCQDTEYGYSSIDRDYISKIGNAVISGTGEKDCGTNGGGVTHDYEYTGYPDQDCSVSQPRNNISAAVAAYDPAFQESITTENGSIVNKGNPNAKNVYSKLGENVKIMTNPYSTLFPSKEDPNKEHDAYDHVSVQSQLFSTGQRDHSLAQPVKEHFTSPVEIINVSSSTDKTLDSGVYELAQQSDEGELISFPDDKDIDNKDKKHIYFELEKEDSID